MKEDKFMSCVGWIIAYTALIVVSVFMSGWALSTIWNWFIVPIFSVAPLSVLRAYGVSMVFSLFTGTNYLAKNTDNAGKSSLEIFYTAVITSTATPILTVMIAWVVRQYAF